MGPPKPTPRTAADQRLLWHGQSTADSFPLRAPSESGVMERVELHCATCGMEIQPRHIAWQISRWPNAVDIRALGDCVYCRIGTRLQLRWYADGRIEGLQPSTGRWVRYSSVTHRYRLYQRVIEFLWLLFGGAPRR